MDKLQNYFLEEQRRRIDTEIARMDMFGYDEACISTDNFRPRSQVEEDLRIILYILRKDGLKETRREILTLENRIARDFKSFSLEDIHPDDKISINVYFSIPTS